MSLNQNSPFTPSQSNSADFSKLMDSVFNRLFSLEQAVNAIGYSSKASKKRRFPQRRQANIVQNLTRALCVETVDPWKINRVRYFHPLLHDPKSNLFSLPFAKPISAMGGFDDCGLNWVPPAGSTIMILFESGNVDSAFYLGTAWSKDRRPGGQDIMDIFPSREWQRVYQGHRKGYLVGPDDESQVYPPWNTESYNGSDIYDIKKFVFDPNEQKRTTYPNIYGFKTPEKHMLKMVDGNAKCNRRWKRLEIMSGCGNWMIFKDDHLHYGGQWAHPSCPPDPGGGNVDVCSIHQDRLPYFSNFHGEPIEKGAGCEPNCEGKSKTQCSRILGGHTSTPCDPETKYCKSQGGANPFFKHKNECRPYKGPQTPQNNKCDLPQSGIQFLSISGHTWVMDDSVEEPKGKPEWERSMQPFDFGCSDLFQGRTYWKSATGHSIMMSDVEKKGLCTGGKPGRPNINYIKLLSASGNRIELNDHTIPVCRGGEDRGIHMQSTSNHVIKMIDHLVSQCSPCRREGGKPIPNATRAYIQIRSGYGLEMRYNDDFSQQTTQKQWIQILHPQCVSPQSDKACNSLPSCGYRGPHILRFQGRPKGQAGCIYLRAGGHSVRQTYDFDVVLVGDKECNPSDKITYVSRKHIRGCEDVDFRYSGKRHVFFAEKRILLLAGRDCPPKPPKKCKGPCVYSVIIARCPVICPLTGIVHWTQKSMSERVFASGWHPCPACLPCRIPGCEHPEPEPPNVKIDTGIGIIEVNNNVD